MPLTGMETEDTKEVAEVAEVEDNESGGETQAERTISPLDISETIDPLTNPQIEPIEHNSKYISINTL